MPIMSKLPQVNQRILDLMPKYKLIDLYVSLTKNKNEKTNDHAPPSTSSYGGQK